MSAHGHRLVKAAAIATVIVAVTKVLALVDADARGTLQLVVPANTSDFSVSHGSWSIVIALTDSFPAACD